MKCHQTFACTYQETVKIWMRSNFIFPNKNVRKLQNLEKN